LYAYGPYVREMNLWLRHVDDFLLVAPVNAQPSEPIDLPYIRQPEVLKVPAFSLTSVSEIFRTLLKLPYVFWQVFRGRRPYSFAPARQYGIGGNGGPNLFSS